MGWWHHTVFVPNCQYLLEPMFKTDSKGFFIKRVGTLGLLHCRAVKMRWTDLWMRLPHPMLIERKLVMYKLQLSTTSAEEPG